MQNMVFGKKCLFALLTLALTVRIYGKDRTMSHELFPTQKEPTPSEWQQFLGSSEKIRQELWEFHHRKGRQLRDWSWQWRIAWVRVCSASQLEYCSRIITQGLADPAMVVRAEAANRIGDRFYGTKNQFPNAVQVLINAYPHPENNRHGVPMFVKFRILEALQRIGGSSARDQGKKLAARHPETMKYWEQIAPSS
ncbi:MAG: hypothetical protein ACOH5I_11595 [Oligoflexus sp.]